MVKTLNRYAIIWSFALGVFLGLILYKRNKPVKIKTNHELTDPYETWFQQNNFKRHFYSMDSIRYGKKPSHIQLESQFLSERINLICIVLVRKRKNAAAANGTWARECNNRTFIYLEAEKIQKPKLPIRPKKLESSWNLLCNTIRHLDDTFHWALFVNDDTFALPENVRRMVAPLNHHQNYYMGHSITFWGTEYNVAQAGYILSRSSIDLLKQKFDTREKCVAGGRFWKQEDYYLGKHLASLGVHPRDTRDPQGLTTFHGHNLAQLLTPGSISSLSFSNYYAHSVYPATKCCSPYAVTFHTIEADKMYTNHYLLYQLQVFSHGGRRGNERREHDLEKDAAVWKSFIREQTGRDDVDDMSPEAYYDLWKSVVNDPVNFNQNIRKWSGPHSSDQIQNDMMLVNMTRKN